MSAPVRSFIFGQGQQFQSLDELKKARALAEAMRGPQRAPQNVGEGLTALGEALAYRMETNRLNKAETAGRESAGSALAKALGGQGAFPPAPTSSGSGVVAALNKRPDNPNLPSRLDFARSDANSSALPSSFLSAVDNAEGGGDYDTLYGFAQRDGKPFAGTRVSGMSVKDAIAFADPSGPYAQSVKEQIGRVATPMGRHQIVGTTLRNAVGEMGIDPNTPFNAQTQDAIAAHLARKRIAGADTMGGKIAGLRSEWAGFKNVPDAQMVQIVSDLEAGGSMPSATASAPAPVQVASLDPSAGVAEALRPMPDEYAKSGMSQATWERMNAPNGAVPAPAAAPQAAVPAPVAQPQGNQQIAQALAQQQAQPQGQDLSQVPVMAGGTGGAITRDAQGGPSLQMLMETANEPFLNDSQRGILDALMQQQMQNSDPMRQLQIQKLQQDLNAKPERKTVTINGRLVDAQTGQEIANFPEEAKKPSAVQEYEYAKTQGFPGTFQDWEASKKGGMSLTVDPATGQVSFQQGNNIKPMTEGQSKDTTFAVRAEGALPLIDKYGDALTSLPESAAGSLPGGVGNYLQSPEYQQAQQAGKEWLQAILRKDTGAAITKEETEEYGSVYLPRPGDSPDVLAQKKASRTRALEALKAGMTPQAILAQEKALEKTNAPAAAPSDGIARPTTEEEYNALPSGSTFIDPEDGKQYRKP